MPTQRSFRYRVVDVFTQQPLQGNALAVFPEAEGIDDILMQQIAKELNLSETVFVFPPTTSQCIASIRIFTPQKELPFAGHPTLGAAFVLADEGMVPGKVQRFQIEEKVGPVPICIETELDTLFWLRTPPIIAGRTFEKQLCAQALGLQVEDLLDLPPQLLSAGNPTVFIAVKDKKAVDRASLDSGGSAKIKNGFSDAVCFFVFAPIPTGAYLRMFAPDYGIAEDPATGSSTGPLVQYMLSHHLWSKHSGQRFISEQGFMLGRKSHVYVKVHHENGNFEFDVGGHVVPISDCIMRV